MKIISEENKRRNVLKDASKDNDYYKSIIENNSFYVVKTDLEGQYSYINPFFCKVFNLNLQEWIGKPSLSLIIPEDHQLCIDTVASCFSSPEVSQWVVLRKPGPTGILSTQWEFKMLTDNSGNPSEILCIGHDITSLIIRQDELEALVGVTANQNKRLVNFTYIVSHNIRSHVANILGIVNMNDLDETDMDAKTALRYVKKSADSLDETIRSLNEIISIQTNTQLPLQAINVQQEIKRIVNSIIILIQDVGTEINYGFGPDRVITTNPAYFESILLNLITNSVKYCATERKLIITIDLEEANDFNIITFRDNGIGIDMDKYRDQLFGMYNTFNGNSDAKGMGLFIIKTQVEAMKGYIEVESELDEYTTFKIFLPKHLS